MGISRFHIIFVAPAATIPRRPGAAFTSGVAQHALRAAEILAAADTRISFLLSRHDPHLSKPTLTHSQVFGRYPALLLHLPPDTPTIAATFEQAIGLLASETRREQLVLYHQSSATLPYAPAAQAAIVTHHIPFVRHVAQEAGWAAADAAFTSDGQPDPFAGTGTWDLLASQDRGLRILHEHPHIVCAEISTLQIRWLGRQGITYDRLIALPRPLASPPSGPTADLPVTLAPLVNEPGPIALTAVARLSQFKNVELFVQGCCLALENGVIRHAALIGGDPVDDERQRLAALVPTHLRERFTFCARVSHQTLVGDIFGPLAGRAVFVCSSWFDLVPYTALEAARAGLCVLVPDLPTVGARDDLPSRYRFHPTPQGLTHRLQTVQADRHGIPAFAPTAALIRRATADEAFLAAFTALCDHARSVCC